MTRIFAPGDGETTTVDDSLAAEFETAAYVMQVRAGCRYKLSFCPEDGGATGANNTLCDSNVRTDAPWAQVSILNIEDGRDISVPVSLLVLTSCFYFFFLY